MSERKEIKSHIMQLFKDAVELPFGEIAETDLDRLHIQAGSFCLKDSKASVICRPWEEKPFERAYSSVPNDRKLKIPDWSKPDNSDDEDDGTPISMQVSYCAYYLGNACDFVEYLEKDQRKWHHFW